MIEKGTLVNYDDELVLIESNGVWGKGDVVRSSYTVEPGGDLDEEDFLWCYSNREITCSAPVDRGLLLKIKRRHK